MRGLFLAKDALELLAASLEVMSEPHIELKKLLDQLRQKDCTRGAPCFFGHVKGSDATCVARFAVTNSLITKTDLTELVRASTSANGDGTASSILRLHVRAVDTAVALMIRPVRAGDKERLEQNISVINAFDCPRFL
jgi:hypothetical protein